MSVVPGNIEIGIKQKSISTDRLFKLANKYRKETHDNPLWDGEDFLHILNFFRFLEKELKPTKQKIWKKRVRKVRQ